MAKANREFKKDDKILCKNGLTTAVGATTIVEIFEQGEEYFIMDEFNVANKSYGCVIYGEYGYGVNFHQFLVAIDPNLYNIYEFFYSKGQQRNAKLIKVAESDSSKVKEVFGYYWHEEDGSLLSPPRLTQPNINW